MEPEDSAVSVRPKRCNKGSSQEELLVARERFVEAYGDYAELHKGRVESSTQRQEEVKYIKLLRAYLWLIRRLK